MFIGSVCSFYGAILMAVVSFFIVGCNEESSSSGGSSSGSPRKNIDIAAARSQSISNLKQIGLAASLYSDDNDGYFPENLGATIDYTGDGELFIAPFDQTSTPVKYNQDQWKNLSYGDRSLLVQELISPRNTTYAYIVPLGIRIDRIQSPSNFPIAFEKPWLLPENSHLVFSKKLPSLFWKQTGP